MGRAISFSILVLATSILLALFYQVVSVFLLPLFFAVVAVLLLRPVQVRATVWCGNRRYAAALMMTVAVLLAILIPVMIVVVVAGTEAVQLANSLNDEALHVRLDRLRTTLDLNFPMIEECRFIETSLIRMQKGAAEGATAAGDSAALSRILSEFHAMDENLRRESSDLQAPSPDDVRACLEEARTSDPGTLAYLRSLDAAIAAFHRYKVALAGGEWRLTIRELSYPDRSDLERLRSSVLSATTGRLASISGGLTVLAVRASFSLIIFVMALFFWFADGPEIIRKLTILSPLEDKYEQQLLAEFEILIRAVVAGSIASAAAQAALSGLGFWIAGLDAVFLLTVASAVFAMVPFVGASLAWGPVSVWLIFAEGQMAAGLGLGAYGLFIVSTVDNLIRPWILAEKASLHPLAALLGVLGGIQTLGPTGVFVGPIVVAFLQTIMTLLNREFSDEATEASPTGTG